MNPILTKLTSRKLWVAVAGTVYFLLQGETGEATAIIVAYLAGQSIQDAVSGK